VTDDDDDDDDDDGQDGVGFGWREYMTWRLQYMQKRLSHKLHAADYLQVS